MNTIALLPDGRLAHHERIVEGDPLSYLGFQVAVEPECCLRSFFRMLESHAVLARLNPFSLSFMDSYRTSPGSGCRIGGVQRLELSRTVEMIGFPGDPSMQIFVSLEGRCGTETCDIKPFWLEQLLDLPLQLGRLKHLVFGDQMDRFDFETGFNLFELIDGICWQLSFHNLPEQCRIDL